MNDKMYKIGFAILLVVNISLVVIFTMKSKQPHQRGMEIKNEIIEELGFNDDQEEKFEVLVNNHRSAIRDIEHKESKLMKSYFDQLNSGASVENSEIMLNEILQLKSAKITVTFNHFEEIKALCNHEQLGNFDQFLERIVPHLTNSFERPGNPGKPPR